MRAPARFAGSALAAALAIGLGVAAAWPIYGTAWLLVPAAAGLLLGVGTAALAAARRWHPLLSLAVLAGVYLVTVVPVAMPHAFDRLPLGPLTALGDGAAAVLLGWKQLLTLTLPVGTYHTVLVPAYIVFLVTAHLVIALGMRAGRFAPAAAVVLVVPVAFGTVFGASDTSASLGPVVAPREIGLWIGAAALGAAWVAWTAGEARREALRRGRLPGERRLAGGRAARAAIAAAIVLIGLGAGLAVAPTLTTGERTVPRDAIDPEIVVRERPSPLATYRLWKRDEAFDATLFTVSSDAALPSRLRLAVLDAYDGVDFHVSADAVGRFTRFPSAGGVDDPATVTVTIGEGYSDIWAPASELGSVPTFSGPRADDLADAFFVNRTTGAAIAVPGGSGTQGLVPGDVYQAAMSAGVDPQLHGAPAHDTPQLSLEAMPELAAWLEAQQQPATAGGLQELIQRLRERGYLSHSVSDREGERAWLERLAAEYGTRFERSPGGHSRARIEQLFEQLNTQERLAGDDAESAMLVAAIGDDEQFAAAAALIARALGFDARVVLGVRLSDPEAGASDSLGAQGVPAVPGVPLCSDACTGAHMASWIEVRGDAGVWAPIDVTPQVQARPIALSDGVQLPKFPTTPEERDAREIDPPVGIGERSDATTNDPENDGLTWVWPLLRGVGLATLSLVFVAVPIAFVPVAKRWRTRLRRGETDPELAALAAWQELVDHATDTGVEIPAGASRREIAEILDTAPARWLAGQVDRAVFSPEGIDVATADWAWAAVAADAASRTQGLGRLGRLRVAYALRSYGIGLRARRWRRRVNRDSDVFNAANPTEGEPT